MPIKSENLRTVLIFRGWRLAAAWLNQKARAVIGSTGTRNMAENFAVSASPNDAPAISARHQLGRRKNRQKVKSVSVEKQATPRSLVASCPWASRFGSVTTRAN